ncbi:MAG: fatty acid cis/trans isomerase [Pseudomonas sp.]|uniref:fatty acid cis/trans isomerase n=1 Tax=Pseudomonas sp. TaxID=306 RepID=UPI0027359EE2|nr:fatty acid cis/trans isomerase [Pseudomonas sp.]MDP3846085.1 fatty acid cis/trans isomerase [Pseudomonas sp.]
MSYRTFANILPMLWATCVHAEPISYSRDVQPIFTEQCVACHACYDAPCQLNLGSAEGAVRGASKLRVYDGRRTQEQATTRLYVDAQGEAAWRRKEFYSVLNTQGSQAALMARMLELGHRTPLVANAKLPEDLELGITRKNQCPLPAEFAGYASTRPGEGMPFAVTGLEPQQYKTLQNWLAAGAPVDQQTLQPSAVEAAQIADWETLLNANGARQDLVGRWLFEHWFIAHLYFEGGEPGHFFQLVRSRTPSGQPIDLISTRRPNEDPGNDFYYRLWPVQGVIVHKTHITYALSAQRLARVKALFYSGDWQVDAVPGYGPAHRANPFATFAAIPAKARYEFMLDDAEYFVRTFIRGPVCRGQIATDVIRDQFWTLFQAPEHDLYITDANYRAQVTPFLAVPGQVAQLRNLAQMWADSQDLRNQYDQLRSAAYAAAPAPSWASIWSGNDNALLSIFRHHDSASVSKGLIGAVPQTLWLMDYPLLERTYYQLVVNYDVFGNVSHQAQTRLYFDLIRNGAEQNFLRLMPAGNRRALLDDWYQDGAQLKLWLSYPPLDSDSATALPLDVQRPKQSFIEALLARYGSLNARPDPINRCGNGNCYRSGISAQLQAVEQRLSRLTARPAASLKVIEQLPEATLLRVELADGRREIYSLLRNRAHSSVAFIMGESLRYQPGLDSLTIYPGVLTSYPNFIFNLPAAQVPEFVSAMQQAADAKAFELIVQRWGIRRSHPQFWRYFHDLPSYIRETEPVETGVLDMNRYQNL